MSIWTIVQQAVTLGGGTAGLAIMTRGAYRYLSKTGRSELEARRTKDLVAVATSLLEPAEGRIASLRRDLKEEETRAIRLQSRIKELEAQAEEQGVTVRSLSAEVEGLRAQLLDAQLEALRLRGLLELRSDGE
jgi:chromosome segregation ATPase